MDSFPKKGSKRSTNKIERHILPSQIQQIKKTRRVQRSLQTLCDREDDDDPSGKSFVSARSMQKADTKNSCINQQEKILDVDVTDSSSESSSESSSISYNRYKQNKSKTDRKAKSTRDSSDCSAQKISRSIGNISSDSNDDFSDASVSMKRKTSRKRTLSSDSESDEDDTANKTSNIFKRISKYARNKKKDNSSNAKSKGKAKKHYDSTSESEDDVKHKTQSKGKRSANRLTSHSSDDERKDDKSSKKRLSKIQENDSDNSSSKEFQKKKLQKVDHNKYSARQLVDLEIDYTKSSRAKNSNTSDRSERDIDEQSNLSNHIRGILRDLKKKCSYSVMYMDLIEQLYAKQDEEQLILISMKKIDKLRTFLKKTYKDFTVPYQLWLTNRKKSAMKRSCNVVDNGDKSSEECGEHTAGEDKHTSGDERGRNKEVSECDSEEIFSADETRTPQKMRGVRHKAGTSRTENNNGIDTDDKMSVDESKNSDKNSVDMQDDLAISPILGTLKEKETKSERSSKKQLFSECAKNKNAAQPDENINTNDKQTSSNMNICNNEIEDSPSRDGGKRVTDNNKEDKSKEKSIINESMDLFDVSLDIPEDAEEEETEAEVNAKANCDKGELLHESVDKLLDSCESYLEAEKERRLLSPSDDREETDLRTVNETVHDSKPFEKTNTEESLDDAEAMAKKALLESDSDISDILPNVDIAEDSLLNDTDRNEKKNEAEDKVSDVNSASTITFSAFIQETNIGVRKDTATEAETEVEKKSDNESSKRSRKISSLDENAEAEEAAKKALLESNSDDYSTALSSESEKLTDKKSEEDSSEKNARAKRSLLAFSSESFISELSEKVSASKSTKRNHEPESDGESLVTRLKKKRRLKLDQNYYYKNDKKLRMSCKVMLTQLSKKVLKRHSRALQKSREYLEHKALKSLVNLDKLEKRRKKNPKKDFDLSTDNDSSSKVSKCSSKRKEKAKATEESLMDHLKKLENGDVSATAETDSDTEESVRQIKKVDDMPLSNEALISEADRIAKENLLNSSDSNEKEGVADSDDSVKIDDKDENTESKAKISQKKSEEKTSKQNDSKKDKKEKSDWRRDKILTKKFSDTDSDAEKEKWEKKQEKITNKSKENNSDSDDKEKSPKSKKKKKKKKAGRRIFDSDSDIKITDVSSDSDSSFKASSAKQSSSDSDTTKRKRRKRGGSNLSDTDSSLIEKKPKPKRKRIKKMALDNDSSVEMISQGSAGKSGRKNIRRVLKDNRVSEDTKLAAKEEEERLKRIAERQTVYNEMYEIRLAGEEKVDKLVLDFDTETKEELVTVHEELVKHLKPHQAQGIKFMWDACFESLERVKSTSGSGCIIAHCMGLGKTLQVIALTHTLLTHEATDIKTVLIVCPLSTVLNWLNEYNTWLKDLDDFEVYELTKFKKNFERKCQLQRWQRTGGVMIIGYEMFRNLTGPNKNIRKNMKESILECLVDPGADLIVCDEGHLLKNEDTALSKCMRSVKTLRRVVLTGTPLQNNLIEYHCMVQFVKPNLLSTKKEFLNRFVNPITNGQFDDSTAYDVKLMKKRAHVLHKMLEGSVQRFDYSVLTPFLPPKQEYVIFVRLTNTQIKMYQYYLENLARRQGTQGGSLFADFQSLQRIWTHPIVLRLNAEKVEKANEKKELTESEGSLKDIINDDSTDIDSSGNNSGSDSDVQAIDEEHIPRRRTRNNSGEEEPEEEIIAEVPEKEAEWWSQFVQPEHFEDMRVSAKLLLLFGILTECEQIGDKVLVFSQSLYSLTLIEEFLRRIDDQTQSGEPSDTVDNHTGSWSLGLDYFRLDGQTSPENRNMWCKIFNRPTNTRARLFLISTRAGGLGINLTAANRVIIFDVSWNPSHDVQSIFRIYRFGQKKPCYVYRFLAAGTMEEKIYNRQVTKLSLSCRVVDEQQIERHYSNHNLNELYSFEVYSDEEKPTLNLPKDRLLAEIFLKCKNVVENYHEHDSLLENKAEEELDEEERKQAWLEYEEEKKGRPPVNPMMAHQNNLFEEELDEEERKQAWLEYEEEKKGRPQVNPMMAHQNNLFLQQYNMLTQNTPLYNEYENLQQFIRSDTKTQGRKSSGSNSDNSEEIAQKEEKTFYCSECNRPYTDKSNMMRHYKQKHLELDTFPCPICGDILKRKDYVVEHLKNIHGQHG